MHGQRMSHSSDPSAQQPGRRTRALFSWLSSTWWWRVVLPASWTQARWVLVFFWLAPIGPLVPFVLVVLFWLTDQMPDMLAGIAANDPQTFALFVILLMVLSLFVGFSGWYWTRAVLSVETATTTFEDRDRLAQDEPEKSAALDYAARVPILLATSIPLAGIWRQQTPLAWYWELFATLAVLASALGAIRLAEKRRDLHDWLVRHQMMR